MKPAKTKDDDDNGNNGGDGGGGGDNDDDDDNNNNNNSNLKRGPSTNKLFLTVFVRPARTVVPTGTMDRNLYTTHPYRS